MFARSKLINTYTAWPQVFYRTSLYLYLNSGNLFCVFVCMIINSWTMVDVPLWQIRNPFSISLIKKLKIIIVVNFSIFSLNDASRTAEKFVFLNFIHISTFISIHWTIIFFKILCTIWLNFDKSKTWITQNIQT